MSTATEFLAALQSHVISSRLLAAQAEQAGFMQVAFCLLMNENNLEASVTFDRDESTWEAIQAAADEVCP